MPAIDPEQVRQFQEFQQFQELMRQQEQGTPGQLQPWAQPPRRRRWVPRFVGKVLLTVAIVVLLGVVIVYAVAWLLTPSRDQPPASEVGGGKSETNLIFETDPRNAVRKIYDDIAQGDPTSACGRFTEEARAEFANHFSGLGGSCEEVVEALNAQVTPGRKSDYANPRFPSWVHTNPTSDTVPVSSCALVVTGGPRLGMLTVSKIERSVGGQWIVTRHDNEPESCAGVPTAPPTS